MSDPLVDDESTDEVASLKDKWDPRSDSLVVKTWSCTQLKVVHVSHVWTVHNFSFCAQKCGERLKSPTFTSGTYDKSTWCLTLFPRGCDEDVQDCISLFLNLQSCEKKSVYAKYRLCLLTAEQQELVHELDETTGHRFDSENKSYGFKDFVERDFLSDPSNNLLPDDKLTIKCDISVSVDTIDTPSQMEEVQSSVSELRLADHLASLYLGAELSDVKLVVGDVEFSAHKAILAARSPVFAAMFKHEMEERRLNKVMITDIDVEVLREVLIFIYTDESPNLDDMASDLLAAADKYDLPRLKSMCEEVLCSKITADSVADILSVADLHAAEKLKTRATTFISFQATDLMKTPAWKTMLIKNSNLVSEAFRDTINEQQMKPRRRRGTPRNSTPTG